MLVDFCNLGLEQSELIRVLRRFLSCIVVVLVLTLPFVVPVRVSAVATADEAREAIDVAQAAVTDCYQALVQAEGAGGNVTELASLLNEAGALLSRATAAFQRGEFDAAIQFSSDCQVKLDGFINNAATLQDSAAREQNLDVWINIVGSLVGAVAVLVAGWILWSYLERKYEPTGGAV